MTEQELINLLKQYQKKLAKIDCWLNFGLQKIEWVDFRQLIRGNSEIGEFFVGNFDNEFLMKYDWSIFLEYNDRVLSLKQVGQQTGISSYERYLDGVMFLIAYFKEYDLDFYDGSYWMSSFQTVDLGVCLSLYEKLHATAKSSGDESLIIRVAAATSIFWGYSDISLSSRPKNIEEFRSCDNNFKRIKNIIDGYY